MKKIEYIYYERLTKYFVMIISVNNEQLSKKVLKSAFGGYLARVFSSSCSLYRTHPQPLKEAGRLRSGLALEPHTQRHERFQILFP